MGPLLETLCSDRSSDRGIAYHTIHLTNYRAPSNPPDLTPSRRPRLVLITRTIRLRPSCLQSRSIATRVPAKRTKISSSRAPTPPPLSSRDIPLYLIYFGVSIWAALAGYGAHTYFSFSRDDSGPRTTPSGPPRKSFPSDLQHAISDLRQAFPGADRVLTDAEVLKTYGSPKYTTYFGSEDVHPHGVVVFPLNTEDVVAVMTIANKWRVPIVPLGNGSSLEGHTAGVGSVFPCHRSA